jgi:hypothetical protein
MNLRRTPQTPPSPAEPPPPARAFTPRRPIGHLAGLRRAEARLYAARVDHELDDDALRSAITRIRDAR